MSDNIKMDAMPNVIHFSITPVAGSPIRIVNALNRHSSFKARHVMLLPGYYGRRVYQEDLVWERDKAEVLKLLEEAQIIHLHHFLRLENNPFNINFKGYLKKGVRIIRQFHCDPETIYQFSGITPEELRKDPLPQLVIAQYPERYFPKARLVPNLVPLFEDAYLPLAETAREAAVFFSPTSLDPAFVSRWGSKGAVETLGVLLSVARKTRTRIKFMFETSHEKCLKEKRKSRIAIDDMVSGSFHLSSLESLAMGIPTFAFLDRRIKEVLFEMTGTTELPWMDFHLSESKKPLETLLQDAVLCQAVGDYSRSWMERHWNDAEMVKFYVRAYNDLLETPGLYEMRRFNPDDRREMWFIRDSHDEAWRSRHPRWITQKIIRLKRVAWGLYLRVQRFFGKHG